MTMKIGRALYWPEMVQYRSSAFSSKLLPSCIARCDVQNQHTNILHISLFGISGTYPTFYSCGTSVSKHQRDATHAVASPYTELVRKQVY
jgi:hypothetical protein